MVKGGGGLQGGGWAHLCIELDVGGAEADEAGEEGLVQMTVLLEGHVLNHRRQLVVVPNQDDSLQPAITILLSLQACSCTFVDSHTHWTCGRKRHLHQVNWARVPQPAVPNSLQALSPGN